MPKRRTFIILIAAIVLIGALCLLVWLLPENDDADESPDEQIQFLIDSNARDAIDALSFVCADNQPLSFLRTEDGWLVEDHPNLPISETSIHALLDRIEHIFALRTITEHCQDLSEYGLDTPYCTIRITSDGEEKCYLFGARNAYYSGYYCMIEGESTVYMVDEGYVEQFDLTLEDLLGSDHLPDLSSLQSVIWKGSDGISLTATPDGEHSALLSLLATLEQGKWIDYGADQYPIYGLDTPTVAELTLWDGASLTLTFGMGETEEFIYFRIGESEMIYLAECRDLKALWDYLNIGQ